MCAQMYNPRSSVFLRRQLGHNAGVARSSDGLGKRVLRVLRKVVTLGR